MDTQKCRALLRAVDTGSFSAAAAELGYTPSGVARMVNALEDELGFALLIRTPRGVTPTPDGELVLPSLREAVRWSEHAAQLGAEIRGLETGRLVIGTYYSVAACWLPDLLRDFCRDYPGIQVRTVEGGNSELGHWLAQRSVDFCFCGKREFQTDWIPIRRDRLVAWLPKDHPKASLAAYLVRDLGSDPIVMTLPGCDTDLERLLEREGIEPDVRFTTKDNYTTYAMVAAGLGVSVNNELMAKNWADEAAVLPLDPPQYISLGIAVPSLAEASPAARKFIARARKALG